jgi:hypothetical protein
MGREPGYAAIRDGLRVRDRGCREFRLNLQGQTLKGRGGASRNAVKSTYELLEPIARVSLAHGVAEIAFAPLLPSDDLRRG